MKRRAIASAGLGVGAALAISPSAQAAVDTFTVDLDDDPAPSGGCTVGACTLREAVTAANADDDATDQDKIVFHSSLSGSVITLAGTELPTVDEPLWIQGLGAGSLTVSGNNNSKILTVSTPDEDTLKVSDITLSGGAGLDGPAINAFDANGSVPGGPALTIENATITGNSSTGSGGALRSNLAGSVTVLNSTISNSSAISGGGGIYARLQTGEALTIEGSTVSGNSTAGANSYGGGVHSHFTRSRSRVRRSRATRPQATAGTAAGSTRLAA